MSHLRGGKSDKDILGDSLADIQEQHLHPSQMTVQHWPHHLQQPAGQGGCGTCDMGGSAPKLCHAQPALT